MAGKGLSLLNGVAGAMDPTNPRSAPAQAGKKPQGGKPTPGGSGGDVDTMSADHNMGKGENFGINELEGKICKDCHDKVKAVLGGHKGATRGEHAPNNGTPQENS